jgi:hypothetical protein
MSWDVRGIDAPLAPIIEKGDNGPVVRLVHAGDTSARKQTARQTAEDPHRDGLDTVSAVRV